MGVKGCAGELTQLEWDHLHTDRGYALILRADEYKKDLLSDRCILNPELSLELDAVWSSNSSIFLLPPNKNHLSVKPLIQSQVQALATCLQRRAQRIQPLNRSRSQEVLLQCLSHGLVRKHFQRGGAGGEKRNREQIGQQRSDVWISSASDPCERVCLRVWEWLDVCAAECCRPLPHSSPPEQIACHHTSITHTPLPQTRVTQIRTPPHPRLGLQPDSWEPDDMSTILAVYFSSQSLYKLGPGRQKQDYLEEVGFIWKSSLSGLWLNLRNWFSKYA